MSNVYSWYKARLKGKQWVKIGELSSGPVSSIHKLVKSAKMALSGSKQGFVSDLELIPLGQFSQYFVPPVAYQVHTQSKICTATDFARGVEGAVMFLFERSERQKPRAVVKKNFRQEIYSGPQKIVFGLILNLGL